VYERHLAPVVTSSLTGFRATVLNGPRQSGKTTLLKQVTAERGSYVSFDDETTRTQAVTDPHGFVDAYDPPLAIDEIQRGGQPVVLAVKAAVDASADRGRFLLAGSTRFLTVPQISESLAGRAEILDLWPLSQGEIYGDTEHFVDTAFEHPDDLVDAEVSPLDRAELFAAVVRGGFPEVVDHDDVYRRRWFRTYLRTVTTFLASYGCSRRTPPVSLCLLALPVTRSSATSSCAGTPGSSSLSDSCNASLRGCRASPPVRNAIRKQ
jgi:uncharacterized protein